MDIIKKTRLFFDQLPRRFESELIKNQRVYLSVVLLLAISGYALILVFPVLIVVAGVNVFDNIFTSSGINWFETSVWFTVFTLSFALCYQYLRFKPASPVGITILEKNQPDLFDLVKENRTHFKLPSIHRIIITNKYELDVVKVPRWALPVWSRNTLVVGLPLLLCVSPQQFQFLLYRKLGQFSKRNNLLTNWLYQHRGIWKQYYLSYGKRKSIEGVMLKWLFFAFNYLYSVATVYVVRHDELNADNYAREMFNHEYVREMMTAEAVYKHYLNNTFWPAVKKAGSSLATPHRKLSSVVHKVICNEKLAAIEGEVYNSEPDWNSPYPSLKVRLAKIAHDEPYMPEKTEMAAATQYLGKSLNATINLMDKLWLKESLLSQK